MDFVYEQNLQKQGDKLLAGIDEAGRGPLAGPVVAAAVIFDFNNIPEDLKLAADSKKLSAAKREKLFSAIIKNAAAFSLGICDNAVIDRINILQATFLAMKKAHSALQKKPDIILIDGNQILPNYTGKQTCVINGDDLIFSIACASILAKVSRDRIMEKMHEKFPRYNFKQHKGYGTKIHMEALKLYGPCEIHRASFRPVRQLTAQTKK